MLGLRFLLLALALPAALHGAEPATVPSPPADTPVSFDHLPVVEPSSNVVLGGVQEWQARVIKAIAPDGDLAIVENYRRTINLWLLLVEHWPYWLGVLAGLSLLIGLWRAVGVIRRRRDAGRPYCRKCNYELTGSTSVTCPECGAPAAGKGRALGKSTKRRLVPIALFSLPVPLLYGLLWIAAPPTLWNWFYWPCDELLTHDDDEELGWLRPGLMYVHEARLMKLSTGELGTLVEWFGMEFHGVTSPDRSRVFLIETSYQGVEWDWKEARVIQRLTLPPGPPDDLFSPTERLPKAAYVGPRRVMSENWHLGEWNLEAGTARNISAERSALENLVAAERKMNGDVQPFIIVGPEEFEMEAGIHPYSVEIDYIDDPQGGRISRCSVIGRAGETIRQFDLDSRGVHVRSPDGRSLWVVSSIQDVHRLERWNLETGQCEKRILLPTAFRLESSGGRLILVNERTVVYDPQTDRWLCELVMPTPFAEDSILDSAGDRVFITSYDFGADPATMRVMRFDLSPLLKAGAPSR
ncbi:MAG: hypothetical protein WD768_11530 [Phycisphaeraceae bacterium]